MAHAFLTVTMQVLHTPEPSKVIAWGPCSCWMYSTLSLPCHHLCTSVRVASCQVLCQAEPSKSGWWACVFNMLWWQRATSSCTDPVCTLSLPKGIRAVPRSPRLCLQTPPATLWNCPVHWFRGRGDCFNRAGRISQNVQSYQQIGTIGEVLWQLRRTISSLGIWDREKDSFGSGTRGISAYILQNLQLAVCI